MINIMVSQGIISSSGKIRVQSSLCSLYKYRTTSAQSISEGILHIPDRMGSTSAHCLFVLLSVCIFCCCSTAVHGARKHVTTALVVGTVYCDPCSHQEFSKASYLISGASVAIQCGSHTTAETISFQKEVRTDQHGEFRVWLPLNLSKLKSLIESCSVKLVRSNEPRCNVATQATGTSASAGRLRMSSERNGVHVFSAGAFSFVPSKQPAHCYHKTETIGDQKDDQPALVRPPPRFPLRPSPSTGGALPFPRPNPLLRPPSLLPPYRILPPVQSPPPSLLSPLEQPAPTLLPTAQPPPGPMLLPPFLLQPPTSQPMFGFPAFPFPSYPLFPGAPPAVPSQNESP